MKDNCIGCDNLSKLSIGRFDYVCYCYMRELNHRYTDEEFPLVEPCVECKNEV